MTKTRKRIEEKYTSYPLSAFADLDEQIPIKERRKGHL